MMARESSTELRRDVLNVLIPVGGARTLVECRDHLVDQVLISVPTEAGGVCDRRARCVSAGWLR